MLAEIIKNTINTLGIFYERGCEKGERGRGTSYIIQRSTKETYKVIKLAHYRFRYVFVGGGVVGVVTWKYSANLILC